MNTPMCIAEFRTMFTKSNGMRPIATATNFRRKAWDRKFCKHVRMARAYGELLPRG